MASLQFTAYGVAQPKGSARAFVPKGWTRAIVTSANPKNKGWQQIIAEAAGRAIETGPWQVIQGPVLLKADFYLPRAKSCKTVAHTKKPDLDKLVRSLKDALKSIAWVDDSQVVEVVARKFYATSSDPPRVTVRVEEASFMEVPFC